MTELPNSYNSRVSSQVTGGHMQLEPIIKLNPAWTGVWGPFAVHLFEGHLSIADMDRMQAIGDKWHKQNRGRRVELVIIFPSDAKMSAEERRRMTLLIKHWEPERDASATVILAEGLLGSIQRSVLTGFTLVVPPPHPMKVFGKIPEAVTWLHAYIARLAPEASSADVVLTAVQNLCSEFRGSRVP